MYSIASNMSNSNYNLSNKTGGDSKKISNIQTGIDNAIKTSQSLNTNNTIDIVDLNETIKTEVDTESKSAIEKIYDVLDRTNATVGTAIFSLGEGIGHLGESIVDAAVIIDSVDRSFLNEVYGMISGNEWESKSMEIMEKGQSFVSKEHVTDAFDSFYDNNSYGQYLKENAYGFETTRTVADEVGYIAGVVALTVLTGGTYGAISGVGFAGGAAAAAGSSAALATTAGVAGFGKGTEAAWNDGADTVSGIGYGAANGLLDAISFYLGGEINSLNISENVLKNTAARVALDGVTGGGDAALRSIIKGIYNDKSISENFEEAGGWSNVFMQAGMASGMSALGEASGVAKKIRESKTIQSDISTKNIVNEVKENIHAVDPEHGFQLNIDDLGDFYKSKLEQGFFTKEQLNTMIENVNNKGFIDEKTGKFLSDLFDGENKIYIKTVRSEEADSIMNEGIRCLGTTASGMGTIPTNIKDISLENTISEVSGLYELVHGLKNAYGVSQGGNFVDGAVVLSIPKNIDTADIYKWNAELNLFDIDSKYIAGFFENNGEKIVTGITENPNFYKLGLYNNFEVTPKLSEMNFDDLKPINEIKNIIDSNEESLKSIVTKDAKNIGDPIAKVRKVYTELNKQVHYDMDYIFGTDEMKSEIKKELFNNITTFENLNSKHNVLCKSWSELMQDGLIESGVSPSQIKIMGDSHKWIEVDLGYNVIICDATEAINNSIDLAASKAGYSTQGFMILDKSFSGSRIKEIYRNSLENSDADLRQYLSQTIEFSDSYLKQIDESLGIKNLSMDDLIKTEKMFNDDNIISKILGKNDDVSRMKKIFDAPIPENMNGYEMWAYYRKISENSLDNSKSLENHFAARYTDDGFESVNILSYLDKSNNKIMSQIYSESLGKIKLTCENTQELENILSSIYNIIKR